MKRLARESHEFHRLSCYQNGMEADLNNVTQVIPSEEGLEISR